MTNVDYYDEAKSYVSEIKPLTDIERDLIIGAYVAGREKAGAELVELSETLQTLLVQLNGG